MLLSVVIIARNEEEHVGACIESVLTSLAGIAASEVILVDSHSHDRTVEVAHRYPIRIVGLSPSQPLCPAMGRHVGTHLTSGRYVHFIDGDTTIAAGWIAAALAFLEAHPGLAAVAGQEDQVYYRNGRVSGGKTDYFNTGQHEQVVEQLGGNGLYRRSALDQSGSFNPFVRSYEEAELGARLRHAGWTIVRIPPLMGQHHTPKPDSRQEYWRRFRNHLLTGQGQVLRLGLQQGLFWEHARRLNRVLLFLAWVAVAVLCMVTAVVGRTATPLLAWAAATLALLALFSIRSRSVEKPLRMVFDWAVCAVPLVMGFLLPTADARHFSLSAAIATDTDAQIASAPRISSAPQPAMTEAVR